MSTEDTPQGNGAPPPPPPAAVDPPPPPPPASAPDPEPPSATPGGAADNRTVMVVLAYLGLFALIPLLVEKDDPEVQWHAKHGLVLTAAEFVVMIAIWIVALVLGAISGGLGCLAFFLFPVVALAILVLHVMCIGKGLKNERFLVPGVSDYADRF